MKTYVRSRAPMPWVEVWSEGKLLESWKQGEFCWWVQLGPFGEWRPVKPGEVKMIVIRALKEEAA